MSKTKQIDSWPVVLLECAARVLVVVFSVALLSIFGYALVGGIVGTIGMMLHLDWLANSAPPIGWLIGAGAGLVSGIGKFANAFSSRRRATSAEQEDDPAAEQEDESAVDPPELGGRASGAGRCCRRPAMGELLKTTSLFTLIGGGLGMMLSAYMAIVLISVTTSPFVPQSWRPSTAASVADDEDPVGSHRRRNRPSGVGAGSSFYHPLLGPIVGYTVLPMLAVGFVAGIGFSCFPARSSRPSQREGAM